MEMETDLEGMEAAIGRATGTAVVAPPAATGGTDGIPVLNADSRQCRIADFGLTKGPAPLYKPATRPMGVPRRNLSAATGRLLLVTATGLASVLTIHAQDLAATEAARRQQAVMEAHELLQTGDRFYENGDYAQAVQAYTGALDGLPKAPAIAVQRGAAIDRLVVASIELARQKSRRGDVQGARETMDTVLVDGLGANDPRAKRMRLELDDPIRTNPALTLEHGKDIDQVRRFLYLADGDFELGRFDAALANYEKVVCIDPYNKAARRGMERVTQARTDYFRAAYDHTRAEFLSAIDAEWELDPNCVSDKVGGYGLPSTRLMEQRVLLEAKLDRLMFPIVDLEDVTLGEAADFLRGQSRQVDTIELNPANRGVSIVVELGAEDTEVGNRMRNTRFDLQLRNVPLRSVLDYMTEATRTTWSTDEFAVVIRPAGTSSGVQTVKSYRVPPDFLSTGGGAPDAAEVDPFAPQQEEGMLARRATADEVLKQQGVRFDEGCYANFNAGSSTLVVRNTPDMHLLIEQIVDAAVQTEPVQVVVRVTLMRTQENTLKELGFDWLLSPFDFGSIFASGGTVGNGFGINDVPHPPLTTLDTYPMTAGLRSGDQAVPQDSIDQLIAEQNQGFATTPRRAPGALAFNGILAKGQVQVMMRALDQKKGFDILSTPATVTRSGQQSSIQIIREFIYPTEYEPPELPNNVGSGGGVLLIGPGGVIGGSGGGGSFPVTPATPTAFEMREVGVTLEVEPVVDAERKFIELTLNPVLTEFDGFVNYGSPINSTQQVGVGGLGGQAAVEITRNAILMPVFSVNRANTALTIADGATIVIGGLLQEKIIKVEDKVPFFGDIPFLGRLFRSEVSSPIRRVVLFFVNVELLDPTGQRFRDR